MNGRPRPPRHRDATVGAISEEIAKAINDDGRFEIGPAVLARLAVHLSLLLQWNRRYNLTAISEIGDAIRRHVLESLEALPLLDARPGDCLADLGSGAGYPGLALLCALDDVAGLLFEARDTRAAFLRAVIRETRLGERVVVEQTRLDGPLAIPDRATIVTLRALPRPETWIRGALSRAAVRVVAAWLSFSDAQTICARLPDPSRARVVPLRSHPRGALLVAETN